MLYCCAETVTLGRVVEPPEKPEADDDDEPDARATADALASEDCCDARARAAWLPGDDGRMLLLGDGDRIALDDDGRDEPPENEELDRDEPPENELEDREDPPENELDERELEELDERCAVASGAQNARPSNAANIKQDFRTENSPRKGLNRSSRKIAVKVPLRRRRRFRTDRTAHAT